MTLFKYEPINLARPTFRLARLLAGSGDCIDCEIIQAWLDQPEDILPYEALSYTWGKGEMVDKIVVNGKELGVTLNLFMALKYLRFENQDRILWIDGLCINQQDHQEKGHQVQQMGDIYHRAERVIVWLGQATYETNVLMDSMKMLEQKCINFSRNDYCAWRDTWSCIQPELTSIHSDLKVRQRNGLDSLFERAWFRRVWILQEVANARAALIMCGVKSISARTFALVPSLLGVVPPLHCQSILDIMPGQSRQKSWWSQKRDLQTILLKFGKSAATDPRDNIYALLGLSSDACEGGFIRADYSKSVHEVMLDAAVFLLRYPELQGTNFLCDFTMAQFLESVGFLSNLALGFAQKVGNGPLAKVLLAREDIDVNWKNKDGLFPLSLAVQKNDEQTVMLLLDRDDVDLNSQDKYKDTPLMTAISIHTTKIVELLLAHDGVDINWVNNDGETPLMVAVRYQNEAAVKALLERDDLDVNCRNGQGKTALLMALESKSEGVAKLLLAREDVNITLMDDSNQTPSEVARRYQHTQLARLWLAQSVGEMQNKDGRTPQWLAARLYQIEEELPRFRNEERASWVFMGLLVKLGIFCFIIVITITRSVRSFVRSFVSELQ
ncbi:ankyrin repeat-containing domain protein [Cadophora sp. MPI-SDFR-AT-0126]|nr:ankyrin repeat-containing domain protein [Leotiomycetes sp. MPI-SDFR-AT-0126]